MKKVFIKEGKEMKVVLMRTNKFLALVMFVVLIDLLAACGDDANVSGKEGSENGWPDKISYGVLTNDQIESYFSSVSFSGSHDNSILAIAAGDADAAGFVQLYYV